MISRHAQPCRRSRSGTQTVQFALIAPLFFVMVLGMCEIGRGMMVRGLLNNASRAGTRVGILSGKTNTDVNTAVDNLLTGQVSGYTTTIQVNGNTANVSTAATMDTITVKISVPASSVSWVPVASYIFGNISGQFSFPHE